MAHKLVPQEHSSALSLEALLEALRDSFPFVKADSQAGAEHIDGMVAQLSRMQAGYTRWKTPPPQAEEVTAMIARLQRNRGNASYVTVAEDGADKDRTIAFNFVPGEEILVGYANRVHEDAATSITHRVAAVLGYVVEPA